jgi:hypothetical protein
MVLLFLAILENLVHLENLDDLENLPVQWVLVVLVHL